MTILRNTDDLPYPGDWTQLVQFLEAETGMDLSGTRSGRLNSAVNKILRNRSHSHPGFVDAVTSELTIGESFFFRNERHFHTLREKIVPDILNRNSSVQEARIWSAGCAGGEEPYSLAILFEQALEQSPDWRVSILGTDLNPDFLERGRQAVYRPWSFRQTKIHHDERYFLNLAGNYTVRESLRKNVRLIYLNLVKDNYPSVLNGTFGMDLILFRNVAIYLKPEVTTEIIDRFYHALKPGGWLLVGETELHLVSHGKLEVHRFPHATFFRKPLTNLRASISLPQQIAAIWSQLPEMTPFEVPQIPTLPVWVPLPYDSPADTNSPEFSTAQKEPEVTAEPISAENEIDQIKDPLQRARSRLAYSIALLGQSESSAAQNQLELSLHEDPNLIEGYLLKASLAEEASNLELAEQTYRQALYLDRSCVMAHFHLALVFMSQGKRVASMRSLQTVLQLLSNRTPDSLIEYGDGVCAGRLKEMATLLIGEPE